jgi:predicted transcriptional regulator
MNLESNHKKWKRSDDATLRRMSKESTVAEIAETLGRTRSSVSGRKYTLGLKGRLKRSTKIGASIVPHSVGTKVKRETLIEGVNSQPRVKVKKEKKVKKELKTGKLSVSIKGTDLKALIAAANAEGMTISIQVF